MQWTFPIFHRGLGRPPVVPSESRHTPSLRHTPPFPAMVSCVFFFTALLIPPYVFKPLIGPPFLEIPSLQDLLRSFSFQVTRSAIASIHDSPAQTASFNSRGITLPSSLFHSSIRQLKPLSGTILISVALSNFLVFPGVFSRSFFFIGFHNSFNSKESRQPPTVNIRLCENALLYIF